MGQRKPPDHKRICQDLSQLEQELQGKSGSLEESVLDRHGQALNPPIVQSQQLPRESADRSKVEMDPKNTNSWRLPGNSTLYS